MPTWCFKSAAQETRHSSTHQWYWQIDTQHTLIAITSTRLFSTLDECIVNARENGFRGEVGLPEDDVAHPALITCEEGDYVHDIVQRSWRDRQELRAV
jgi:hypothetical protein